MSFPRYPKYKPSGVEWLGEVPEHWSVTRLKGLCRLVTEKADTRNRAVALEHIESGTGRLTGDSGEFEGEGTAFVRGDLLFGKLRPYLAKAWVAEFNGEAVGDFHVMRPARELSQRYLLYTTLNRDFIQLVDGSTYGSKMPRASWDFVGCMPVCEPSVKEQRAIAAFLDRETAKIDALIAEQEKLIELLSEKRQAVISHAVTKGLNPAAPMKPSGVEWLGDVPAHWTLRSLKRISPFMTVGIVVNPSDYVSESGLPFIYGGDIREGVVDWTNARRIDPASSEANAKTRLEAGDILTVRVGAPGVSAVVPESCAGGNCASVMLIKRGEFCSDWLCFAMNSRVVRYQVELVQYGAAQEQFNISHAVNFFVPTPPLEEQRAISAFLQQAAEGMIKLVSEASDAVQLLRERRSALISAAVTGQIDVRNAVPETAA